MCDNWILKTNLENNYEKMQNLSQKVHLPEEKSSIDFEKTFYCISLFWLAAYTFYRRLNLCNFYIYDCLIINFHIYKLSFFDFVKIITCDCLVLNNDVCFNDTF